VRIILILLALVEAWIWERYLHVVIGIGPLFRFDIDDYLTCETHLDWWTSARKECQRLLCEEFR